MSLTVTAIKAFKPQSKPKKYFDEKGLYILVSPNGGKWWRIKYRIHGKEKLLSLGTYPEVGLAQARENRDELRKQIAKNIDPSTHRKYQKELLQKKKENSFETVAREWLAKKSQIWAKTHLSRNISRLERDIFPKLGKRSVDEITPHELLNTIRIIEERGAVESAHRTLSLCSQIFRYAVQTARALKNPTSELRGALASVEKRHLTALTSPKDALNLMGLIHQYQGHPIVCSALKLAPLVFVRPGELRTALWKDIDFEKKEWRFFISKTKTDHIVPLAEQAITILQELSTHSRSSSYVFPNARSIGKPMSENAILNALRSLGIPKDQMTGHGFRAMARTLLDEELGFRVDIIEHQLAHSVRDPLGRAYNRTSFLEERKKMMQSWANWLYQND